MALLVSNLGICRTTIVYTVALLVSNLGICRTTIVNTVSLLVSNLNICRTTIRWRRLTMPYDSRNIMLITLLTYFSGYKLSVITPL